jgi:hypothetical protein
LGDSEEEKLLKLELQLRLDDVNLSTQRVLFEFNRSLFDFRERVLDIGLVAPHDLTDFLNAEYLWDEDVTNAGENVPNG